jgi:dihydrolipoamide dehydrogenase
MSVQAIGESMPQHDLTLIGGGPGGYVAAIRAAQLGLNVACIEKESTLGGTCVRVGCIPSKALLESSERFAEAQHGLAVHGVKLGKVELDLAAMLKRKDDVVKANTTGVDLLFKKNKVTRYLGHGRITGKGGAGFKIAIAKSGGATEEIETKRIVIATGSSVFRLPGVEIDGDRIGTSTEALAYSSVPKHLVVIGAGYIGLELGSVWQRLGSKVTVIEYLDRILPGMDAEIAAAAQKVLQKQGLEFKLKAKVTAARWDAKAKQCVVTVEGGEPIECDRVLVAVGRVPNTEGLGHESIGLQLDPKGRVPINEHFETSAAGVYAIGDVVRGPMLAHKAEDEGVAVAEIVATGYGHVNYDAIPGVVYTHPEVATVGKSEEELKSAEVPYRKGVFQFRANGRARALNQVDGFVKVLAHKETDRVLGVHIIGPRAGDLIAEAVAAMEFGASSEDIARTCHAHPTLAEAVKEAALAVDGRAIHS